jgi:hypothetical protein
MLSEARQIFPIAGINIAIYKDIYDDLLYTAYTLRFREARQNSCPCRVLQRGYQGSSRHDVQQMLWRAVLAGD